MDVPHTEVKVRLENRLLEWEVLSGTVDFKFYNVNLTKEVIVYVKGFELIV